MDFNILDLKEDGHFRPVASLSWKLEGSGSVGPVCKILSHFYQVITVDIVIRHHMYIFSCS